jgi:DNA-binding MarR family transcriptional regulator
MSELSEALQLQPSTVTGLVDALVELELVERRDDPEDRRVVRAALTAKGAQGRESRRRAIRQRLAGLLGEIDDDGLRSIHSALTILHDAATNAARDQATSRASD